MRSFLRHAPLAAIVVGLAAGVPDCWAQKWEVGVLGGGSVYNTDSVKNGSLSGDVGFKTGGVVGAYFGSYGRLIGGELRYEYFPHDLKVSSSGAQYNFSGLAHAIHYDFVFHFLPAASPIRPFVEGGGGVKIYEGTGSPVVSQPLGNLALLTNTHETKGLGVVGGGVKARIGKRMTFRAEVADFITPFPRQVIAPAPGSTISGVLHDIVFMAGIGIGL